MTPKAKKPAEPKAATAPPPPPEGGPPEGAGLYERLSWLQASVTQPASDGENTFHHYDYVTAENLWAHVRPLLARAGLVYTVTMEDGYERTERATRSGSTQVTTALVTHRLCYGKGEDRECLESKLWAEGEDPADKGFYKLLTGGAKYFWFTHLLLASKADDPETSVRDVQGPAAPPPAPRRSAAPAPPPAPVESLGLGRDEREQLWSALYVFLDAIAEKGAEEDAKGVASIRRAMDGDTFVDDAFLQRSSDWVQKRAGELGIDPSTEEWVHAEEMAEAREERAAP